MAQAMLRASKSSRMRTLFRSVRHLFLETSVLDPEATREILNLCTGLVNFASNVWLDPTLLPVLGELHLRTLSLAYSNPFGAPHLVDFTHPAFSGITHLDVFDDIGEHLHMRAQIPLLRCLTHLGLNNEVPWDVVQMILAQCPRLEVLIAAFHRTREYSARDWVRDAPVNDARFVVTIFSDYAAEWVAGAKGLPSSWSFADDFVARKPQGKIDAECYLIYTYGEHGYVLG
ncbi:hypothetical protein FB451DRAFT_1567889 [Mycena latifolia]|nr:hypothetical protein FB451DRAFT_1380678 [Mycena latifolia]KAJ7446369.1 hypothetical protein FB451DRAFT_1567889 [Mycena latifolia]